jgi:hypothetical protein
VTFCHFPGARLWQEYLQAVIHLKNYNQQSDQGDNNQVITLIIMLHPIGVGGASLQF